MKVVHAAVFGEKPPIERQVMDSEDGAPVEAPRPPIRRPARWKIPALLDEHQ
jgi:hypothetical protein